MSKGLDATRSPDIFFQIGLDLRRTRRFPLKRPSATVTLYPLILAATRPFKAVKFRGSPGYLMLHYLFGTAVREAIPGATAKPVRRPIKKSCRKSVL